MQSPNKRGREIANSYNPKRTQRNASWINQEAGSAP